MTNPYPQQQYAPPAPPARVKRPKRWPWILGMIGTLILGILIGSAGNSGTPAAQTSTAPAPPAAAAPTTSAPAAPAAPAEPAGPKTEFGDGTYLVGTDIAAGTYKSAGPRAGSAIPNCYWARMKDDSGQVSGIIANNNSSGPSRITVKKGEYLQVAGCDFAKA